MATADDTLRAVLSETEYEIFNVLARSRDPVSGRAIADAVDVSPTTANKALAKLEEAGFATMEESGRSHLWRLEVSNQAVVDWLDETSPAVLEGSSGSSPYSTGGGGVTLEHSYAACLIAGFLAGETLVELGDAIPVDSIQLQASDVSDVDDIVLEGRGLGGERHRSSIAVRRSPDLTKSDSSSVPLVRDFLTIVVEHWAEVSAGRWRLVLAVSTNSNAVVQLSELAELARSLPNGRELESRLTQAGRTNEGIRDRYDHVKGLVRQAAEGLHSSHGLTTVELTWRLLSSLAIRHLRLERTDYTDRTIAVNALKRTLVDGTPTTAVALFTRIAELAREWARQGAVLDQSVVRRSLSEYPLTRSARYGPAWDALDRLGERLREAIDPGLQSASHSLELERADEKTQLVEALRDAGSSCAALVITGDPDVGKSALSLRAVEALRELGAVVVSLSLRDLPSSVTGLETLLGGAGVGQVLAAGAVRPIRILLVDGAECVLEGKGDTLRTVAAAALRAGFAVVAVTRLDGAGHVRDVLTRASDLSDTDLVVRDHVVGRLTEEEQAEISATFPELSRLRGDPRSVWLLSRPGLVDALLRTGRSLDPSELLCEADVFRAVWSGLVRRAELRTSDGASADDRELAALKVARRSLGETSDHPSGTATAELRSDGVLRPPNDPALSAGDEFASDLFRDFALARLFIVDGWDPLKSAEAPRWAIRAARLGCQAAVINSDTTDAWITLQRTYVEIAEEFGHRWLEVPYEALLTLGDARSALRDLWNELSADDASGVQTLLRLAHSRYVEGTFGDPYSLAPIVEVAFCEGRALGSTARIGHDSAYEFVKELVLAWLRGMATAAVPSDPLRQRVRDTVLDSEPAIYDDFAIEALATLGPDIDSRAEEWLREVADERPGHLHDAVESVAVSLSMPAAHPQLLLVLAEAYYIEKPEPEDLWSGMGHMEDGIRDFKHGLGFGAPFAAWYYGPFFRLLNTAPSETIGFINRMLDHAAEFRVGRPSAYASNKRDELPSLQLDLPGPGSRRYVGDSAVWSWYRGTSVGPYACMSALLALERFIDHLHENLGIPARAIVELALRDCHNLAVPGLLLGFLVRHECTDGELLDPFLKSPSVWHLESARITGDYGFSVRDRGADELTGSDRRNQPPQQTVGAMVVNARLTGDAERLTELEAVGRELVETAREELATAQGDTREQMAVVESWAAMFRIENYRANKQDDQVFIGFERPEPLEEVLAPRNAEFEITNLLLGFQNRYGRHNDDPTNWPTDSLVDDLARARELSEAEEVPANTLWPEDSLVSVAAAAVRAHATGTATIAADELAWAAEAVLWGAENPRIDDMSSPRTTYVMGADRAAAAAVPLLLLEPFDDLALDSSRVKDCLDRLATSLFDEVRAIYSTGCKPVWAAPCDANEGTGPCHRHAPAWLAATAGLADCRLGPWNAETQKREPEQLVRPFDEALPTVADDALRVNRLRMPVACMVDASRARCLQREIDKLWDPLWDAHRRGLEVWWKEGYDHHAHISHEPIARRMIEVTLGGDREPVRSHIEAFARTSRPLHLLFDGFATVFTYEPSLRQSMDEFWPWALELALDAVGNGDQIRAEHHWFDYAVAALLPTPAPRSWDSDIDGTLAQCRADWLQPEALNRLEDQWLALASGEAKAVDAVINFARSAPPVWQTTVALTWVEEVIDDRHDFMANRIWHLEEWLGRLRDAGLLVGDVKRRYHRIIDGLAAAGDRAAVRLQQLDE